MQSEAGVTSNAASKKRKPGCKITSAFCVSYFMHTPSKTKQLETWLLLVLSSSHKSLLQIHHVGQGSSQMASPVAVPGHRRASG